MYMKQYLMDMQVLLYAMIQIELQMKSRNYWQ